VVYLFANEVPEIEDEIVRSCGKPIHPLFVGPRTKIAVDTLDRDPVGARDIQRNELWVIDVIFVGTANAPAPARDEVRLMEPESRQTHVLVAEDQLSLAIGKEGQMSA